MTKLADRLLLAGALVLLPLAAQAATPHLGMYLKTYYTDYQIVKDCASHAHLAAKDADTAKAALAKIEAYYLQRDPAIKKDALMKQAVTNKNIGFKMIAETGKVDIRQFCHAALNDLTGKLQDLDAAAAKKASP